MAQGKSNTASIQRDRHTVELLWLLTLTVGWLGTRTLTQCLTTVPATYVQSSIPHPRQH